MDPVGFPANRLVGQSAVPLSRHDGGVPEDLL
jgi:hypothetical protein